MTNETQETEHEQRQDQTKRRRLCDYCNDRVAVLYCRADSAKLCLFCDKEVHSTNQLFSKHSRSQLCDVCDASPASIFCETEHSVLCTNCDWEKHNQSNLHVSSVHNRRPIESFTGFPSVSELFTIIGFDDLDSKSLCLSDETGIYSHFDGVDGNEFSDLFAWEAPDFVSIDDLIVSSEAGHNFQALSVPPLPKNRNAACGQHKEEMLHQLRQLAKLEPNFKYENANMEPIVGFQSLVPEPNLHPGNQQTDSKSDVEPIIFSSYEASTLQWLDDSFEPGNQLPLPLFKSHNEESYVVPDKYLDSVGCVSNASEGSGGGQSQLPTNVETSLIFPRVSVHELNSQERDSALSRYKEKKKTRRYDKHIRYESRKARAESRTRIKGRFAKIDH